MAKIFVSTVIPVSPDRVWQVLRNFNSMPMWHPGVASSQIEDDMRTTEVGCVRRLDLANGSTVREQLIALDDMDRSYAYEFVDGPFPVRTFHGTIYVRPITDVDHSFVEWAAVYNADPDHEVQLRASLPGIYLTGLRGLASHLDDAGSRKH